METKIAALTGRAVKKRALRGVIDQPPNVTPDSGFVREDCSDGTLANAGSEDLAALMPGNPLLSLPGYGHLLRMLNGECASIGQIVDATLSPMEKAGTKDVYFASESVFVSGTEQLYRPAGMLGQDVVSGQGRVKHQAGQDGAEQEELSPPIQLLSATVIHPVSAIPATRIVLPTPAAPTLVAANDSGSSSSDNITSNRTPTVTGTAEPNQSILLYDTDSSTLLGTAIAAGDGRWSLIVASPLTEGSHVLRVRATDSSGNVSGTSSGLTIVIDTVAPGAPAIAHYADNTGSSQGNFGSAVNTDDVTPTIRISLAGSGAEAGDLLDVLNGTSIFGTILLNASHIANGYADLVSNPLSAGEYILTSRLTDIAGNVGNVGSAFSLRVSLPLNLTEIASGSGGFAIGPRQNSEGLGLFVSDAGDVNGDGWADVIVGANSGARSYVVFGGPAGANVDLAALGSGGFSINRAVAGDMTGFAVSAAGDVNADGLADLLVGAYLADPSFRTDAGTTYVVFGKKDSADVNLANLVSGLGGGYAIQGENASDWSGYYVSGIGDLNQDGRADIILSAVFSDFGFSASGINANAGRSYVVFGKADAAPVSLSNIAAGIGGFAINAYQLGEQSGIAVAGAGDVNGDGLPDLVIGANQSNPSGLSSAGRVYVAFGKAGTANINLADIVTNHTGGFVINGAAATDSTGISLSGGGDVNGDGLADLLIGASGADPAGKSDAGRGYVVFGKSGTAEVSLASVAAGAGGGFVINGVAAGDGTGWEVSIVGDVNGDGLADLLLGAPQADPAAGVNAGSSYLVYGKAGFGAIELSDVSKGIGGFAINGQAVNDNSGYSVSGAGDIDGDGLSDLLIGAPGNDSVRVNGGRVYAILSSEIMAGKHAGSALDQIGTSGNDLLTGTSGTDHIAGGTGNDTLAGNGGADVLYGGGGNDILLLNAGNVASIATAVLDGGLGIDTLKLAGAGIELNLTAIAGPGIRSIEKIDLTGSGDNTLRIALQDVLQYSGANIFNNGSGWIGLAANVGKVQMVVDGNAGDTVVAGSGWIDTGGSATDNATGQNYRIYEHGTALAQLLIDTDITRNVT